MNITTLNIQQSLNNTESITHDVLGKIYAAYKDPQFKVTKSTLRGSVSTDLAYQFWIDELTRKWSNFKISTREYYHYWADPVFRECIAKVWGDNYGIAESQLNKNFSFSCTQGECEASPFFHNTEVEVIDLRPFTNISRIDSTWNWFRIHKHNEDWDNSQMKLKEIYVQCKTGQVKVDFWGGMYTGEHLEKLWVEGPKNPSSPCLTWSSVDGWNTGQTIIDHYYFRNNCTITSNTPIQRDNGSTFNYLNPQSGWQFRGWWAQNIILDSPIPLQLNDGLGWGNGIGNTTFYVPDHQLSDYVKLYNIRGEGQPKAFKTWTEYNITYPRFARWYEYEGIDTYTDADSYLYADGNS